MLGYVWAWFYTKGKRRILQLESPNAQFTSEKLQTAAAKNFYLKIIFECQNLPDSAILVPQAPNILLSTELSGFM